MGRVLFIKRSIYDTFSTAQSGDYKSTCKRLRLGQLDSDTHTEHSARTRQTLGIMAPEYLILRDYHLDSTKCIIIAKMAVWWCSKMPISNATTKHRGQPHHNGPARQGHPPRCALPFNFDPILQFRLCAFKSGDLQVMDQAIGLTAVEICNSASTAVWQLSAVRR